MAAKFQTRFFSQLQFQKDGMSCKTLENDIHKNKVLVVEYSKEKITLSKYCSVNMCILSGHILIRA